MGREQLALAGAALAVGGPDVQHVVDAVGVLVLQGAVDVDVAAAEGAGGQVRVRHVAVLLVLHADVVAGGGGQTLVALVGAGGGLADRRVAVGREELGQLRVVGEVGVRSGQVADRVAGLAGEGTVRANAEDGLDPGVGSRGLETGDEGEGGRNGNLRRDHFECSRGRYLFGLDWCVGVCLCRYYLSTCERCV